MLFPERRAAVELQRCEQLVIRPSPTGRHLVREFGAAPVTPSVFARPARKAGTGSMQACR